MATQNSADTDANVKSPRRRSNSPLPADLDPASVIVIQDTREQCPLDLSPLQVRVEGLPTADYVLAAAPNLIAVERKSLDDLLAVCGRERERFERELDRLLAFQVPILAVEADWAQIRAGEWRSALTPAQVEASLLSWASRGVGLLLAGDHATAGRLVSRMFYLAARRRYRELRQMVAGGEG